MKILVTGASGFIGRYVVSMLAKTEHDIIATSTQKTRQNLENINRLKYISADLNNREINWYELFCQPDAVIHLAWQGVRDYNKLFHFERNLWMSYQFLKQFIESGTQNNLSNGFIQLMFRKFLIGSFVPKMK
jgi:dTDP-6-deoxy-L-talose 4-dehydrogenase (NAD+)